MFFVVLGWFFGVRFKFWFLHGKFWEDMGDSGIEWENLGFFGKKWDDRVKGRMWVANWRAVD